jgi:hypothetical protein
LPLDKVTNGKPITPWGRNYFRRAHIALTRAELERRSVRFASDHDLWMAFFEDPNRPYWQ